VSAHGSLVFALTGGIGCGKSTVARLWKDAGLAIVDADSLAKEVVATGSAGLERVAHAFGPGVLTPNGELDRAALGQLVFGDAEARARLEAWVHPLIRGAAEARFAALERAGERLICYEIPLLFETGQAERFRPVIVVDAPDELRVERITERDGLTSESARQRVAAQWPLAEKVKRADAVIDNGGSLEQTAAQADALLERLRSALV